MHAFVFSDAALKKQAGRFVWLSIDVEKDKNAGFLEKFPVQGVPSFFVIDPATGRAVMHWYGTLNREQFGKLLEDSERALKAPAEDTADAALARADRLNGERKTAEAVAAYREAIRLGGSGWGHRPRAVESLAVALQFSRDREACARLVMEEAPSMRRDPSFANTVSTGLTCALNAPSGAPWRPQAISALRPLVEEALAIAGLLADDRSGLYDLLVSYYEEQSDPAGVKKTAGEWLAFLEKETERAPNADARTAFDGHRVTAALKLGDPARAVPALQASERALPDDYNPPARLAVLYRELGHYDEALAASNRALAKAYGPRRLLVFETQAAIYRKKGDVASARRTLEEALKFAGSLPKPQDPERQMARIQKQLDQFR